MKEAMMTNDILSYCLSSLKDTTLVESWGEKGIFYNPNSVLKRGVYVLTIKEKDGNNDKISLLNRDNVYRVNVGLRKQTFIERFGYIPKRPSAGNIVKMDYDFTILDTIIPHPVYAWMGWVCVLNPSNKTFEEFKIMIQESYEFAKEKFVKRKKNEPSNAKV
ncbi:DUF6194 family protein [Helicobacter sp.]|uniref:DUF6194 family protein n=1 Tax=Helicobacter sp. TaxID=218 RepID=UPI0025C29E81|nr:DUF6194 family protein [Helicobacter sp.]